MNVLSRAALFEDAIADAARKEGVDPKILWTIAYNETRFRPWLTSPKNARGLMQFIPGTAARFGLADPYEPTASIHAAARYVRYLDGLFGRRIESVLAAYNSGEGTVLAFLNGRTLVANHKRINPTGRRTPGGVPPYRETLDYVANGKRIYRWLEGHGRFPGIRKGPTLTASIHAFAPGRAPKEENSPAATSAISVLYDPRTGDRHLVDAHGKLSTIDKNGPVVISPAVRGLPTQKARSTFAGPSP
ncbi:MAG: lytic transglycosylase domain-containing protein [Pyrinomonadaceae bacterium]